MNEDRRDTVDRLFDEALDLPAADRAAHLDARCGDDAELRTLVEKLLRAVETRSGITAGGALRGEVGSELERELEHGDDRFVGSLLGRYRVVEEIGRGGMAVVYRGERDAGDFEQRVAIKVMRGEIASAEALRRFERERQILAASEHPGVARLLDGGVVDGHRPYLVMEYVDGEQIDRFCDRRRLNVRERIELFLDAARAVEHAHRSLVVHRDLKPSNLLVTGEGRVKLLDFGIAKLLDDGADEATRTELRALTPAYASPEQIRGEPVTTATDVYQLGLLLYLLLTGCWPYPQAGGSDEAWMLAITRDPPTRPSAALERGRVREVERVERPRNADDLAADRRTTPQRLARQLRGDLDTILLHCLRKDPERRYGTVTRLVDDLERHLAGRPISARPDTLAYRTRKFLGRHRVAVSVGAAGLAALVALAAWDGRRLTRERDRAQREAAKATEVSRFLTGLFAVAAPTRSLGEAVTARQLLDRGAARVREELAAQPEVQAEMMALIGSVYGELAHFEEGEALLEAAIATRRRAPGPGGLDLAAALAAAGQLHERNKDLKRATAELEEALELRRSALGPDAPEVARTESRLGAVLVADGELDRARSLLEHAVASLERSPDGDAPDLGRALTQLAIALRDQRDYPGSIPLFERAIALLEPALGPDHPDTILPVFNLAYSLRHTDDFRRAEELYLDSIARYERLYGTSHPRVATAYNNFSLLLRDLKRWDEAVARQQRALEIWRATLGEGHIQVAWAYNNLGLIEERRGRPEAARDLYLHSLEITEAAVEPGNAELHVPLQNYGRQLVATGRAAESIPYFLRALAIRERVYGEDHSFVGRTCAELGEAYLAAGDLAAAEASLRRAIALGLASGTARDTRVTQPVLALARTLRTAGRAEEARALLAEERAATNDKGRALLDAARDATPGS